MTKIDNIYSSFIGVVHEGKTDEKAAKAVIEENVVIPKGTDRELISCYELENITAHIMIAIPVSGRNIYRCEICPCSPKEAKMPVLWVEQLEETLLLKNLSNKPLKIVRHLKDEESISIKFEAVAQKIEVSGLAWIETDAEKIQITNLDKADAVGITETIDVNGVTEVNTGDFVEVESDTRFVVKKKNNIR